MRIDKQLDVPGFLEYVKSVQSCGDHPIPALTDDVLASVVAVLDCHIEIAETYEDTEGRVLVRLADDTYGVFFEWSDSSGHG